MSKTNHKHKTVGVSLSPVVRERANRRSRQLGMSFSRYMSLCVEAEIAGIAGLKRQERRSVDGLCAKSAEEAALPVVSAGGELPVLAAEVPNIAVTAEGEVTSSLAGASQPYTGEGAFLQKVTQPALGGVITDAPSHRGGRAETALLANEWLLEDVADLLLQASVPFLRKPSLGGIRADFFVQGEAGTGSAGMPAAGVVVECRYPVATAYTVMLGRAVMLQQMRGVQAVVLCVPYLSAFDRAMITVFERQSIGVTTPDALLEVLARYLQVPVALSKSCKAE